MFALLRQFVETLLALRFLPRRWQIPCFVTLGVLGGSGLFVAHLSRAPSYLSDDPETCVNCHVMTTPYLTWQHSSHAAVATCNDCHVPHTGLLRQYAFKAQDGLRHAAIFTLRWEPQVIRISRRAVPVVQENCRRCHARLLENVAAEPREGDRLCWDCHREVPHGSARSLSSTLDVFRPQLAPVYRTDQRSTILGRRVRAEDKNGLTRGFHDE